jgi:hypothetical protein
MIDYASPDCQRSCEIVSGPVHGVDTAEMRDGSEAVVFVRFNLDYDTRTSEPLKDLGETDGYDNNQHYLEAVRACSGAVACGLFSRKTQCGAMVGDHPLRDYRVK